MIAKNLVTPADVPVATIEVTRDELNLLTTLLYYTSNNLNDASPIAMCGALRDAGGNVTGTVRQSGTSVYVEKK